MKFDKSGQVVFRDDVVLELFADVSCDREDTAEVSLKVSLNGERELQIDDFELEDMLDLRNLGPIKLVFDERSNGLADAVFFGISDALGKAATVSILGTVSFLDEEQEVVKQNDDLMRLDVSLDFGGGRHLVMQANASIKSLLPFVTCRKVDSPVSN